MKFNHIKMWPLFLWLVVLNLSTDYVNTVSTHMANYFMYYILLQFALPLLLLWLRINSYMAYILLVGIAYAIVTIFAQTSSVIYILGLLPLIFIDVWLQRKRYVVITIFSIFVMFAVTIYSLITNYSIINTLVIFDAIILVTGMLYYYTEVTRKIIESEQKNSYLVKQMEIINDQMENMVSMREKERYAQDLHDNVTQDLIAIKLQLELIHNHFNNSFKTKDSLKSLIDFTQRSVTNARTQIATMKKDVKKVNNRSIEIFSSITDRFELEYEISINSSIDDIPLSNHVGVNLSSILNELLTNVVRHSESSSVVIFFKKDKYGYGLSVIDFGIGMPTVQQSDEKHFGLQGISERVKNLNGILTIVSDVEEGTSINVSLPQGLFE